MDASPRLGLGPCGWLQHPLGPLYGQTVQLCLLACQLDFQYNPDMANTPKTERFEMRAPTELLLAVDEWRRHQADLPSRSEAIRRLIEAGLNTAASAGAGDKPPGAQGKGFPPTTLGRSSSDKPAASKPAAPPPPKPRAQSAAMSKEQQIRALREQGAG